MRPGPLLRPVGPLPAGVYWRRRLVLLASLLILVAAVAYATTRGSGGADTVFAASSPSPMPSASPTTRAPSATPTARASAAPSASLATTGACAVAALTVAARTDQDTYPAGATPRLTLTVTNTGATACRADLGAAHLELRVYSGADRVWSTDDCVPGGRPRPIVLPAHGSWSTSVSWSRTRSRPGCPSGEPKADPGTYRLYARLDDQLSAPVVFHLR